LRVALWSPRTGGGWVATLAPLLERDVELVVVSGEPPSPPTVDVNVYHLDDDPAHEYVYRALFRRRGVVVLEDWGLHRLVHAATAGRGDEAGYRREGRRTHGELGTFVTRQVIHGLGGVLPEALLTMNESVVDAGLGFVATSTAVRDRLANRCFHRPVIHLPLGFQMPAPLPPRDGTRASIGLSVDGRLVVAVQPRGSATAAAGLARALDEVDAVVPRVVIRWAREGESDVGPLLAAADVVVALEHPPRPRFGEAVSMAVTRGKAVLVSAGSGAARELPDGLVAHVSPGSTEVAETVALVQRLLADEPLRSRMGRLARSHAAERHDPEGTARALLDLLRSMGPARETSGARPSARSNLATWAMDEVAVSARELGLAAPPSELASLTCSLFGEIDR
jgi:glycosyltransferase involved in cell wall biosynthesis